MTDEPFDSGRTARVNYTPDGRPLGIAMFITACELRHLDINLEMAESVVYAVDNGTIRFDYRIGR